MPNDQISIPGDLEVRGDFTVRGDIKPDRPRSELAQETFIDHVVPMSSFVVHDSGAKLPTAAATDDMAHLAGTFGTNSPYLSAGDLNNAGATTRYAMGEFTLPQNYDNGESVRLRLRCGMLGAIADTSCTVDVEAYLTGDTVKSGSDLVSTSATTMNSLTFADVDFTVTATSLSVGDTVTFRIAIACNDAATGSQVEPTIAKVSFQCDIRG